jgi:putative phosphoribosyl transferase
MRFRDREDAGRHLAAIVVQAGIDGADSVVAGLPRGGVPVAYEVARALVAPLDIIVVRKLGVPFQPELAMGAIGEGGVRVENEDVARSAALHALNIDDVERHERAELQRRAAHYRGDADRLDLSERQTVVVDDGVATGSSARAACLVARTLGARRVVLAAPVVSRPALGIVRDVCDEVVYVAAPDPFYAVGEWYEDFSQTTDDEVIGLLRRAADQSPDARAH